MERTQNSFFHLKKNDTNKLMSQLNVDGKVINDQKNIASAQKNLYENLYSKNLNSNNINYKDSLNNF